jgi:hypothetical protein
MKTNLQHFLIGFIYGLLSIPGIMILALALAFIVAVFAIVLISAIILIVPVGILFYI